MNELELKYGCNPNQKPARVFMKDGADLPFTVLNGKPGLHQPARRLQLVAARARAAARRRGCPPRPRFKHVCPAGAALGLPLAGDRHKRACFRRGH